MELKIKKDKGIVITTSSYTKDFLKDCLLSLQSTPYDILILSNDNYTPDLFYFNRQYELIINPENGWEIAGIQAGKDNFNRFVHIMDTTLIKDIALFDKLFEILSNSVLTRGNFHYQGCFNSKELPNLPIVHDKVTAIMLETRWLDGFKYTEFQPDLPVLTDKWEMIHGMKRMRLENEYMIKWKGTAWVSPEQLAELTGENKKKLNESTSKQNV